MTTNDHAPDLLVVGGGPAGLARAFWALQQEPERAVAVFERAAVPGGWARTKQVDGFNLELGPQALRPTDDLDRVVRALGVEHRVRAADATAKRRFIGRGGRLIPTPSGPLSALTTRLLPLAGKLRLLRELGVKTPPPDGPESLADFAARRFGASTVPLLQAVIGGIHAGDATRLEAAATFPALTDAERDHGSVIKGLKARAKQRRAERVAAGGPTKAPTRPSLVSFEGGLGAFMQAFADALGPRLRLGSEVRRVGREGERYRVDLASGTLWTAREVAIAAPARIAAPMLRGLDSELADELAAIEYASLASVYLDVADGDLPDTLRGFGFLLEPGEDSEVLGTLLCSDLFPDHAPDGRRLLRVMMGGERHPETVDRSDPELLDIARAHLRRYTGFSDEPRVLHIERVRDAIPQYHLGHVDRLSRIRQRLAAHHPGLTLLGNSYDAIAMVPQLAEPAAGRPPG